jgi:RHS repeat-associated protein
MAVINPPGTNTPDTVSTTSGNVYAPPQQEVLEYDDDGNLLSDGRWHYMWNGENRLVKAEELLSPPMREPYVVEYSYDHRGRMIWKTVASPNAPPSKTIQYTWDDYNIIAEAVVQDAATNTTYNVWGLDLDGTMQGAGGVGGLLAVVKDSASYIPSWDANGNVMEYVSSDGTIAAHREYDPFGGTVVYAGNANAFTHWFSTKPWCTATGLSEYQYRKYSPVMGRWLARDPIEEEGGENIFAFVLNESLDHVDVIGLISIESIIMANIGGDISLPIFRPYGLPLGTTGLRFQIHVTLSGNFFSCCRNGENASFASGTVGVEAYIIGGRGKDRIKEHNDRNKPDRYRPGKRKFYDDEPPDSGYRSRTWHMDFAFPRPDCPADGLHRQKTEGVIFLRGSAGVGFAGVQFNIQKKFAAGVELDEGWSLSGSLATGVWGATIEGGGGGSVTWTFGPVNSTDKVFNMPRP